MNDLGSALASLSSRFFMLYFLEMCVKMKNDRLVGMISDRGLDRKLKENGLK